MLTSCDAGVSTEPYTNSISKKDSFVSRGVENTVKVGGVGVSIPDGFAVLGYPSTLHSELPDTAIGVLHVRTRWVSIPYYSETNKTFGMRSITMRRSRA